jgi:hypothetical protein|tara:strand:+ start:259 stop:1197 length:939 start_codon:yes stop_codon:yes gene_type:complete
MYTHGNFTHPGGVSPMKQEKMIDPNANEGSGDAKVGNKKQSEIDYERGAKELEETVDEVQDIANWAPVAGEAIDAKNAVKDIIKGDYGGAALNAAGFAIPFIPGSIVKKGVKKIMEFVRKQPGAEDAIKKGRKLIDDGGSVGSKPKGGVANAKFKYEGATNYTSNGKITDRAEFNKMTGEVLDGLREAGKSTDEALSKMNWNASTDLNPDHITKLGTQNGRGIFEVAFPDGTTQKFWRSTGTGGKSITLANGTNVASEGFFGALPGHMDVDVPGMKVDGWFIKGQDWQGYGSKTYTETGAKLKEMFDKGIIK